MKSIITGLILSLLAIAPANAWELYTDGAIEPSIVLGLEHRPGESVLSHSYGMPHGRGVVRDDSTMPHFGLHGLTSGERGDYPCLVEFEWTQMTGGDAPREHLLNQGRAFDRCGNRGVARHSVQILSVDHGLGSWATGMTVCSNSNGRIKGIRLHGTRFFYDTDTKEIRIEGTNDDEFSRTNCGNNWGTNVSCGAQEIIVGMDVFYMPDRNGRREADSIIGFRMYCRGLRVRS